MIFLLTVVLILLFLKINDTVDFTEGEIYSDNPQLKIITSDEVRVLKTNAREGQEVKKGDTLFVLENVKTQTEFNIANIDIVTMQNKIDISKKLIFSAKEKKSSIQQLISIQSDIYDINRKKTEQEINTLNKKIALASQQTDIINDRYKTDSILYARGVISRIEFTEQKNQKIEDTKEIEEIVANFKQKSYDYENLTNNFQKTNNDLKQNLIEVENQIISYERDILELQSQIDNKKYNLNYITDELGKLLIIAPIDGTISNIFNSKQNLNIIDKGELLSIIAPTNEKFYAKISLPEKDITYIKTGQAVNLKIDAYNYYKFGAIKGNITYISPSDVNENFYCIATLNQYNSNIRLKAGYKFKGKIIIDEMKFYQYIIKKLFNKIDNSLNPIKPDKHN
ncbi:hypothetical protein FACS189432_09490 [Bacteroidia bacterium]|nr:hypothetical protein FACS189432_09490 [Bacteroidia bacterium]